MRMRFCAISSQERRDNPCALWIGTKSVNDSAKSTGAIKNLCGGTPTSRAMRAEHRDDMGFGRRVFVTGIRMCANNKGTRVKGFSAARQADRGRWPPGGARVSAWTLAIRLSSGDWDLSERDEHVNDSKNPADYRNNCKEWHAWAECPHPNQVAIGLIAHFEAGKEPRSLSGVRLQCRYVAQSDISAIPK
jgi:hypothetical protein